MGKEAMKEGIGITGLPWDTIQPLLAPRGAGGRINVENFLSQYKIHFGSPTPKRERDGLGPRVTSPAQSFSPDSPAAGAQEELLRRKTGPAEPSRTEQEVEQSLEQNDEMRECVKKHVEALYLD